MILDQDLSWGSHINTIATKANQKLGFIKRNLKRSPQELKRLAYIALVRSSIEYASVVWDPHLVKDKYKLEQVQRRAARWITRSYEHNACVTALLQQLKLEPLEQRRRINRLTFLYKILNEQVAVPPDRMDLVKTTRPVRGSATQQRLTFPIPKTKEIEYSFTSRTVSEWNILPDTITSLASVKSFRSQVTTTLCP